MSNRERHNTIGSAEKYLEAKVMTAPPQVLHLMVVEAAIRQAARAEQAQERKDYETAHFALNSSRGCVMELISGLNAEHAPDLVDRLKALFLFAQHKLVEADAVHDPQRIRDALTVLRIHHETWLELTKKLKAETAGNEALPGPHRAGHPVERSWTG